MNFIKVSGGAMTSKVEYLDEISVSTDRICYSLHLTFFVMISFSVNNGYPF